MNENQIRVQYLLDRLTGNEVTKEEFDELFSLINREENEEAVKAVLREGLGHEQVPEAFEHDRLNTILTGILSNVPAMDLYEAEKPVRRMGFWPRFAAAAAILLLIGGGVWYALTRGGKTKLAEKEQTNKPATNDVIPGGNKAILTLADNSTIILDSAANGKLAEQGSSVVNKTKDGELRYEVGSQKSETAYNTLSTPRGGQYQLVLPDGSKVWLNAASSIRYPTAFTGNERVVEITGEAYFEVAKAFDSRGNKISFAVDISTPPTGGGGLGGLGRVEVLGTHFNINAYDDEPAIKTTLLEGAVRVTKGRSSAVLKPGEQVSLSQSSQPSQPIPVQTDEVMAWKNGLFYLTSAEIPAIMRQISRWYNVNVEYENGMPEGHISGKVSRSLNLSQVLQVLEISGVHFKIEGNKIIVMDH